MGESRFDTWTRLLGRGASRRGALVGLVAAAFLVRAPQATAAERRRNAGTNPGQGDGPHGHGHAHPPGAHSPTCGLAGQFCGDLLGVECCGPLKCTTTLALVSNCVLPCTSDEQCQKQFIYNTVVCKADALTCPLIKGGKCCVVVD